MGGRRGGAIERTQLLLNTHVTLIRHEPDGRVALDVEGAQGGQVLRGASVIVTLPPRLFAGSIHWEPALPASFGAQWQRSPTWMAGHAKMAAAYKTPFWRDPRLSGYGFSQSGPLV